jgi:hypothetical protein
MDDLTKVWADVAATLPDGWSLDSLRCASTSPSPKDRSDDWIAVAVGPDGEERRSRAADPLAALRSLGDSLRAP